MLQKIIVGALVITIIGAAGIALLDARSQAALNAEAAADTAIPEQASVTVSMPDPTPVPFARGGGGYGQGAGDGSGPVQQQQSLANVGQPWSASGVIATLDAVGLTLNLPDGSSVYVELGPTAFWQGQGVELKAGDSVAIEGFFNGDNYHARLVTSASGAQIALRTEAGQPLWSGGQSNGQNGQGGAGVGQVEVAPEDWVTVEGTVATVNRNGLTLQTQDGQLLTLQFGRSDFWQGQAVAFTVGDAVSALGFWQGNQFQAAQVTRTATGERILLRDPNGRPLWGGPGRNGNGNAGGAQGGNGQDNRNDNRNGQGNRYGAGGSN